MMLSLCLSPIPSKTVLVMTVMAVVMVMVMAMVIAMMTVLAG